MQNFPPKPRSDKCLGHDFVISGFNDLGWAEINIEAVTGSLGETIWVESEFLQLA
jgi:hypothetical protein